MGTRRRKLTKRPEMVPEEDTPAQAEVPPELSADHFIGDAILELETVCSGLDGIRVEEVGVEQAHAHALALEAALGRARKFAARLKARA